MLTKEDLGKTAVDAANGVFLLGTYVVLFIGFDTKEHIYGFSIFCISSFLFFLSKTMGDKEPESGIRFIYGLLLPFNFLYPFISLICLSGKTEWLPVLMKIESVFSINWILPIVVYFPRYFVLDNGGTETISDKPFWKEKGKLFFTIFFWILAIAFTIFLLCRN